jgi:NAD(P)-dependent dehydrogenase (short-subunit alcohol dehydrogenase family)
MTEPIVLLTGGTGGIGLSIARALVRQGAQVAITGRNADHGEQAIASLEREGSGSARFVQCDHSSIEANRELSETIDADLPHLDLLINNAGGMAGAERRETAEGIEVTLATNAVAPWLLIETLLPVLQRAAAPQVLTVVSTAFKLWTRDPLEDLGSQSPYAALEAYSRAKLISLLATFAWRRRLNDVVAVSAVAPPMAWTPNLSQLTADMVPHLGWRWPLLRLTQRRASPDKAARRIVGFALPGDGATGAPFHGPTDQEEISAALLTNTGLQDRVWIALAGLIREKRSAQTL